MVAGEANNRTLSPTVTLNLALGHVVEVQLQTQKAVVQEVASGLEVPSGTASR